MVTTNVVPAANKQLERTVIRRRMRAASAPFHYALAARWTAQRAAAQLRRQRAQERAVALWQFDIELTGRNAPAPTVTDELYEVTPLAELTVARARSYLRQHFGEPWEMLPRWFVFGLEDGSRFDLHVREDGSGSVRARVDARADSAPFLRHVLQLAQGLGCELYLPERNVTIQPTEEDLRRAFSMSAAVRFVGNPIGFFSETSQVPANKQLERTVIRRRWTARRAAAQLRRYVA